MKLPCKPDRLITNYYRNPGYMSYAPGLKGKSYLVKILYINILYSPYLYGGAERTVQAQAEGIAARGHDVTVLTTGPDAGLHEDSISGVRVVRAGVRNIYWHAIRNKPSGWKRMLWHMADMYNPLMKGVVSDVVRAEKPDVVSVHHLSGFSVSAWDAVRQAGVPMMQVLHDQYLLCPRCIMFRDGRICEDRCLLCRTMRLFHPRLSNKVDAVVGVSKFILDHLLRHGYFRTSRIKRVIHSASYDRQALAVPRREPDDKFRLGFIGTLDKSKGIELLLRTFKEVAKSNWELHIAGSGPSPYEKFLRNSYAASDIIFHGVQKPEIFYPGIDLLVVPSIINDTLPGVVFEGMSYGIPVIGARRGGIPEMIEHGVNGLLFNPDRPDELKAAMIRMAEDAELRGSTSRAARDAALYFLDVDRYLSSYEELFQELCKKNPH